MYKLFFPYPVKHSGLFSARNEVILDLKKRFQNNPKFVFSNKLPDVLEVRELLELVAKDSLTNEYLGSLFLNQDKWLVLSSLSDLRNLKLALEEIQRNEIKHSYIFTNSGGHHANNKIYQLFCPLNQLFFIIEHLNYTENFPKIAWIDIDAHFGNGDKELFDQYKERMRSETVNVTGVSLHNDSYGAEEEYYMSRQYSSEILENDFISLVKESIDFIKEADYLLLFFGTDIFTGDYGGNKNVTINSISKILSMFEKKAGILGAKLIAIQTGGNRKENLYSLIEEVQKRKL